MSNYRETQIAGTRWTRCGVVQIINPYQRTPAVQFVEEVVTSLGEGEEPLFANAGGISVAFDPNRVIPLRDPFTGELTGQTTTYGAVHAVLYSAYMDAALERDAKAVAVEPEESDSA